MKDAAVRRKILAWFAVAGRDLPWRHTRDPYAILVSEVMLQQTQVARVIPVWHAFLEQFPTWEALAAVSPAAVLRAWAGMGYNRRALALQRCAQAVVTQGGLPTTLAALIALPGIGPYTAAAVMAFAFRTPHAAPVDTNIARVLRRIFGLRNPTPRALAELAARIAPKDSWTWNHALMDFGSAICTARAPRCEICPVRTLCASYPCAGDDAPRPPVPAFADSDRQYRGRILALLRREGTVTRHRIGNLIGLEDTLRLTRLLAALQKEGLLRVSRTNLSLPE